MRNVIFVFGLGLLSGGSCLIPVNLIGLSPHEYVPSKVVLLAIFLFVLGAMILLFKKPDDLEDVVRPEFLSHHDRSRWIRKNQAKLRKAAMKYCQY